MADIKNEVKEAKKPTAAELVSGLIISVGEARKLLGPDTMSLSDDDIAMIALAFADIAPDLLKLSNSQIKQL